MATMNLTPSQRDAVTYTGGDSLIVAGAGSGKTLVLIEKVAWIVEQHHVPLDRIVIITFTEKAAGELKERLARRLPGFFRQDVSPIGTIHSFAASLIRQNAARLEIDPEFEVMDEPLARLERDRIVREGFLRLVEAGDSSALKVLDQFGFYQGLKVLKELFSLAPLLGQLNEDYAASKREKKFLDFRDLEDLALKCRSDYAWIFVDEFQDTSPRQWELISLLHDPKRNRLTLVGDPRQSIYRFRGADPHLFEKAVIAMQEGGGRILYLNENFRSRAGLIAFVNRLSERLFSSSFQPLVATRPSTGEEICWIELPKTSSLMERRSIESQEVVRTIVRFREKGRRLGDMALLFRTRRAVPIFEEELRKAGIPYQTKIGTSLLERPEVVTLILWMRFLADPEDKIAKTGLDYSPLKELPPLPLTGEGWGEGIIEPLFEKSLPFFPDQANLIEFKKLLFRLIRLGAKSFQEIVLMIERLRREESRIPAPPDGSAKDAVQLLTIHAAKGLEFPVVFLCDLAGRVSGTRTFLEDEKGIVLREKEAASTGLKERLVKSERFIQREAQEKEEDLEESKRLLYVALTRASELLVLPVEREIKKSAKGGRWIDWIVDSRVP